MAVQELIGVTPNRPARTQRFAAAVFATDPADPTYCGGLAAGAGYFDQSYFGHGFRECTAHDTSVWGHPKQRRAPWAR